MSKFLILISFSILLSYVHCKCKFGSFTDTSPCDTQATPIQYKMYTSTTIEAGQWAYYYIPLGGIESNIKLFFNVDGALPDAFLNFQPAYYDNLPTEADYYYGFHVKKGGQEMPPPKRINGIENFDEAIMILGLLNRDSSKTNIEITYSATKDSDDDGISLKRLIVGVIVSVAVIAVLFLCIGGYSVLMLRRYRRGAAVIQGGNGTDIEAQSILQNNNGASDHLSLEDLQKYFPKKPFKELENPFQQIGCSVCLEDFTSDISCHQLYCNHIFHETCVEKWLEKHNSCPGCRVPIGKKAIEAFLQKQKEEEKKDNSIKIEIKSPSGGTVNKKENNNQVPSL